MTDRMKYEKMKNKDYANSVVLQT